MSKQSFDIGHIVYIDHLDVFTVEMRSAIGQFREQHLAIIAFHRHCHHRQHYCHRHCYLHVIAIVILNVTFIAIIIFIGKKIFIR